MVSFHDLFSSFLSNILDPCYDALTSLREIEETRLSYNYLVCWFPIQSFSRQAEQGFRAALFCLMARHQLKL